MQIPMRRAQKLRQQDDLGDLHVTPKKLQLMQDDLKRLEKEQPQIVEEVDRTRAFGDFSENAEYQDAKFKLRRINDRIFLLKEKIKRAIVIESNGSDRIALGSRVTVHSSSDSPSARGRTFQIVGPQESNPSRGRISHLSPLGSALIDHIVGDTITLKTKNGDVIYKIIEIT